MNPSQLKETVFEVPEAGDKATPFANRNLYQVTVEDAHRANAMVELWMGAKVAPRKSRLMRIWDGEASFDELDPAVADPSDPDASAENGALEGDATAETHGANGAENGSANGATQEPLLALAGADED